MRWWLFGLVGGFTLSVAAAIKFARLVLRGGAVAEDWYEAVGIAAALFPMGFACGAIVWAGRGLYARIGMAGDAIVGLVVMVVFFLACMLVFEPALLGAKFSRGGRPMLVFAAILGPIVGAWCGRDLRREFEVDPFD